jgi:hypothetical protein
MRTFIGVLVSALAACAVTTDEPVDTEAETAQPVSRANAWAYAGEGWEGAYLPQRAGRFTLNFSVVPFENNGAPIDAVIGLANGPADAFTDLGPIVRLNSGGTFDARDGSSYRAIATVPYRSAAAGQDAITYNVRMDISISRRAATRRGCRARRNPKCRSRARSRFAPSRARSRASITCRRSSTRPRAARSFTTAS